MSASYLEATARERILAVLDAGSFKELLPPAQRVVSPHLGQLDAPVSFDDGVIIGEGLLGGRAVMAAAQEGGFMGGAVGEVHGAKLVGLLKRAIARQAAGVILLLETGGVRLHEANAGLIAVSEVMRAVLEARAAGIPVIVLVGGANGCFGGMGIVARCANTIIMSEEGRLAMSGPEVIETANGVEEFDSRDRALVWRTTGGKHRYLIGDCQQLVGDDTEAFRAAAIAALAQAGDVPLTLAALEAEQDMLRRRIAAFGHAEDPMDIWAELGVSQPEVVPMLEAGAFTAMAERLRIAAKA
ncbi:biotin-independent malonate decarboxylase subunit beta [Herbaspirillum rubrisubalbicans]|uniref:Biotin-independent malonate decarboxylase subunit beta n=1 Tax=Herbaspirillum rubrisubalbicans TaxID=80842 RepID=A0AAD0UCH6_9BURK|nr:biotin-independent malonate decarboxylase subunit beta [Herbaspirillum rubrisubalbicans]ALU89944.1 acetyl-CoA carboxylase beta subunit protein [Herbaspirillum rubrisubalbicans M1]AYR25015.1 biotin-independent malonate decarboxylase subunit beta [Herbaspirillum rubrisubalbicans]